MKTPYPAGWMASATDLERERQSVDRKGSLFGKSEFHGPYSYSQVTDHVEYTSPNPF